MILALSHAAATGEIFGMPLAWVPQIGATGLLAVVVLMVLTGRLVPGKEMRYWREMAFEEQRQKRALMETGRITQDVLKAIPEAIRGDSG